MGDAPGADELESRPSKVAIVATRVDGDIEDPAYICTVHATSGEATCWPICRRLSRFAALREQLLERRGVLASDG